MTLKMPSLMLGLALTVATATAAYATPTTYFGENLTPAQGVSGAPLSAQTNFLSRLIGVGTEGFESFADGRNAGTSPLGLTFPSSTATPLQASLTGDGVIVSSTGNVNGRYNTTAGGSKWWDTDGFFVLNFATPISAFGFYGTDIGDFGGQITLQLTDTSNRITTLTVNNTVGSPNGSLLFFGFIDSTVAYKKISFGNTSFDTDGFGFDSMTVGDLGQIRPTDVPEPTSLALVGLALTAAGFAARRRRA